jgi:hypothetical protein
LRKASVAATLSLQTADVREGLTARRRKSQADSPPARGRLF